MRHIVWRIESAYKKMLFTILGFVLLAFFTFMPQTIYADSDTGFNIVQNGFPFGNNWGKICITLEGGTKFRYDSNSKFCPSMGAGLCGGMSLLAGERFLAGMISYGPAITQASMKGAILNAQMQTLDAATVSKFFAWMASPNVGHTLDPLHSIGYRMKDDWNNDIKPRLDRREPVVLGLIFSEYATLADLTFKDIKIVEDLFKQHMILGIGYKMSGSTVTMRAYDPDAPACTLQLSFTPGHEGVSQALWCPNPNASGQIVLVQNIHPAIRGIMFVRGVSAKGATVPICPAKGVFSTTGDLNGCECPQGSKKVYEGIANSQAACTTDCPKGSFSTTGEYRDCSCPQGSKKVYEGVANSQATCTKECPDKKFTTTGEWRDCSCPEGKKKKYDEPFKEKAECR